MSDVLILRDCAIQVKHSVKPAIDGQRKYIGLEHIEQGTLRLSGTGIESDVTSTKTAFDKGDVLFGKLRPYFRKVVFASFNGVCSTDIWVLRAKPGINPRFLYYWVASQEFVDFAVQGADGTRMPRANWAQASQHSIPFQTEHEQKAIAHILGTLDDKIDQLRKTNSVLEDMASALFKSWFVDFDPVMAKQENRPTGLPSELDALFPDSFEESSIGPIPTGWRVCRMGDIINVTKGVSYKSSELAPSNTALVTLKSFNRGGGYRTDGVKSYTGKYKPTQLVSPDELIIAYTDVTQDALVIGKPARVTVDSQFSSLVASCDVGIVRPLVSEITTTYLYELFMTLDFQNHIYGHTSGTTVLHLSSNGVQSYETHIAPFAILEEFSKVGTESFSRKKSNIHQIRTLTNLRDTLLPKLISGELRVPEAEQMVAELGL
jgi:type I restriction enzyme S subunit